eukprot:3173665-Amphidinium_carterae.1
MRLQGQNGLKSHVVQGRKSSVCCASRWCAGHHCAFKSDNDGARSGRLEIVACDHFRSLHDSDSCSYTSRKARPQWTSTSVLAHHASTSSKQTKLLLELRKPELQNKQFSEGPTVQGLALNSLVRE